MADVWPSIVLSCNFLFQKRYQRKSAMNCQNGSLWTDQPMSKSWALGLVVKVFSGFFVVKLTETLLS